MIAAVPYTLRNLIPLVVALAVPVGTWLAVRRRLNGQVTTSDAADLWRESGEIRREQREVERQLREEIRQLHAECHQLRVDFRVVVAARDDCMQRLEAALRR